MKRDFMTTKGLRWGRALAVFVFAVAMISGSFLQVRPAYATGGISTWTGAAGDNKFSTATNWQGDVLPTAGDVLVFNQPSGASATLDNDLDLLYGGLSTGATSGFDEYYYFLSNDLRLAPGATITSQPSVYVGYQYGSSNKFIATGDITIAGPNPTLLSQVDTITYSGEVTVQDGYAQSGAGMTKITLSNSDLYLNGSLSAPLVIGSASGSQITANTTGTLTLSGATTLNSNLAVDIPSGTTVEFTGPITANGHTITKTGDSQGTLIVPGQSTQPAPTTVDYNGGLPTTNETVSANEIATLSGSRQTVTVNSTGTLKGTGMAQNITALPGSTIAPGNSPGTLTVTDVFDLYGTYQAEILNASNYDKVIAGEGATPGTTTVLLRNGSTLNVSLYAGWSVTSGDTFTIIDNRGDQPVSGVFDSLPEGQQFSINGITFNITYIGGDGNDVVLTALTTGNAPTAGNTGAYLSLANPVVIAVLGVIAGASVLLVARRNSTKR
jgi:hypothetical protein